MENGEKQAPGFHGGQREIPYSEFIDKYVIMSGSHENFMGVYRGQIKSGDFVLQPYQGSNAVDGLLVRRMINLPKPVKPGVIISVEEITKDTAEVMCQRATKAGRLEDKKVELELYQKSLELHNIKQILSLKNGKIEEIYSDGAGI
ncbi:MAG: hypothetical protein AABX48_03630 [Nanoarchaeota archaeon]